ncbi:MAG: NYN domain-containing protein, partial [Candidatus Hadarchaeota archaeon]
MIFIDGSNLFHACKAYDKNFKIDFLKLKEVLSEGRKLIRPYYYASFDPTSQSAEK